MQYKPNHDTENSNSDVSNTTDNSDDDPRFETHFQQDGRYILIDSDTGDRLNVSRLTAYAEYGKEIYGKDAHHEISLMKIDAPRFIDVLPWAEHGSYHGLDPDPVDVDGFPLLRKES